GLCEPEDIVNKEQYVTSLAFTITITEVFSNSKTGKGYTCTCPGRLVHLTEHECTFRVFQQLFVYAFGRPFAFFHAFHEVFTIFDDTRLQHFAKQVVPFTGTLTYTGKYG